MLDTCVIWRRGSRKENEYETTQNWDGYIGENAGEIKVNRGCLIVKIMYNDIQQHSWLAEMRANIVNETFLGKRRVYIVLNTIWQCCFTPHPPTPSFSTHMKAPSYNLMTFKDTYIAWRAVSSCWGGFTFVYSKIVNGSMNYVFIKIINIWLQRWFISVFARCGIGCT
jgi:hypothetical protein